MDIKRWNRRIPQVSLRIWLLLFSAICIWIGWFIVRAESQQECVAEILQNGGGVIYSHSYLNGTYIPKPRLPGPTPVREWLGIDYVDHVIVVDFNHHPIKKLPALNRLPRLTSLWLYDTSINDLSPVSKLKHLENLWIQESRIDNLEPIRACKNLKWLNIAATDVSDLTPLFHLPKLETLILNGTQITPENLAEFRSNQPNCQITE